MLEVTTVLNKWSCQDSALMTHHSNTPIPSYNLCLFMIKVKYKWCIENVTKMSQNAFILRHNSLHLTLVIDGQCIQKEDFIHHRCTQRKRVIRSI